MFCNVRVSIPGTNLLAVADGVTDDAPAINYAVQHCPNNQYVYLPAGTYRTNSTITRQGVNEFDHVQRPFSIELKGDGPGLTKILFYGSSGDAIYFNPAGGENAQTMAIASGDARGSTQLVLTSVAPYLAVGIYAIVHRINAEATTGTDPAYMIDTASQMVKVTAVNTGTNTINFTPALNESYPSDYVTLGISAPFRTGVQDLYVENMTNNNGHNINFVLGQECWVKNVESVNTAHWHIRLQTCARCEVRECVIHDGWSAGGDHDYGAGVFQYSCNNLVENNVFYHCRHAMEMEYGGQGNVFGYNYSYDPVNSDLGAGLGAELATDYLMGDQLNHGGDIRWNLREGNVVATIRFDCVLGASSYNTVFRNQIQRRGLAPVIVANYGSDIQKWNYYSNLSGNVYEAPPLGFPGVLRRWGTDQDSATTTWTVTGASNSNPVVVAVSGTAFATGDVVTVAGVLGNTAANVANATITYVDASHFSLNGVDGTTSGTYAGGGSVVSGPDAKSESTTLLDGEHDVQSGTTTWAGSDHSLPASYYLPGKPAWFGSLGWPAVDPSNPSAQGTALIPAGYRQANGAPAPMAPYVEAESPAVSVAAGTPAVFTAEFAAFPAPTVQWQVSTNGGSTWTNITGAAAPYTVTTVGPPHSTSATDTLTTLTVATAAAGLTGNLYQCVASNTQGEAASAAVGLTVTGASSSSGSSSNVAPSFSSGPSSTTATYLTTPSVTFTATANGNPTPTYQWMLGGTALHDGPRITGSATSTLTITAPVVGDSGIYTVVASNGVAPTATSTAATLTVSPATQTIAFSLPSTTAYGSAAPALSARATSGLGVTYTSSNVSVATVSGNTLTITGPGSTVITASQGGNSSYGPATSVTAALTVTGLITSGGPAAKPAITSATTAGATMGTAFAFAIAASNTPTAFTATGLPAGLSVSATTGIISGTPTKAGSYSVSIGASNADGTGSGTLTVTVAAASAPTMPAVPVVTSASSTAATVESFFSYTITGTNTPTAFTATNLPPGLSLAPSTGVISGTPTTAGSYSVSIGASNVAGAGGATLTVTVAAASAPTIPVAPVVTSATSAAATVGAPFSFTITGTNSPTIFTASNLPPGLSLAPATGVISGTPTKAGSYAVPIGVTNVAGSGGATLTVTVATASAPTAGAIPVVTSAGTAAVTVGSSFSYTITATNSPTSYSAVGLPAGLVVNSASGVISGSASSSGSYQVTLGAKNAAGSGSEVMTLTVNQERQSGAYFGTFGSGGSWALSVATDNTGLFLSKVGGVAVIQRVNVDSTGHFTVASATTNPAIVTRTATTASLPYVVALHGATASGTAGSDTMSGAEDVSGAPSPYAGGYVTTALNGSTGNVDVVVGPDGRLLAVEIAGSASDTAAGTLSSGGTLNAATSGGGNMTVTTSPSGQMLVTFTSAGTSTTVVYLGLSIATSSTSRIINLSARGAVGTGANVMIAGAVLTGAPTPVLFRAVGPTLASFGVANALANPELNVFQGSDLVASNTTWGGGPELTEDFATAGAFALPGGSADDALQTNLAPAPYTIQISGDNSTSGVALAEIYTLDTTPAGYGRLIDISARAQVTPSSNLIAGFVISGNGPETVLLRGIGPGLAQFGVTGALASPILNLMDSNGNQIAMNQGWAGGDSLATASTAVGAFAVDPASKDSELLVTLAPGSYTAVVASTSGSGTALVEVYEVPGSN